MFTGIVERLATIKQIEQEGENIHLYIETDLAAELKIDQSVAHNGICLTVVSIRENTYKVTAIKETIDKTTIGNWHTSDLVNIERGMKMTDRLDGHIVQGHIDQTATCIAVDDANGSLYFTFEYDASLQNITIEKGSITIDGTSLTVVDSEKNRFRVAIIPYTLEHTLFKYYEVGTKVNIEFDVIGKYVRRLLELRS